MNGRAPANTKRSSLVDELRCRTGFLLRRYCFTSSTRRFFARPCSLSFGATGDSMPTPAGFNRAAAHDYNLGLSELRAAAILRREAQRKHTVGTLARRAGASRSVLSDDFRRLYGMTMSEYQARARMVAAVISLRTPRSNVDAVAREAGYRRAKNFYVVFRKLTGRTRGAIRTLSESSLEQILLGRLALPRWLAS